MARDPWLVVLAALTILSGLALVVMALRRRRARAGLPDRRSPQGQDVGEADHHGRGSQETARRRIDDYAIPVSFDRARERFRDEEPDIGKICPRCGARYGSHHRLCERDNSELAALN